MSSKGCTGRTFRDLQLKAFVCPTRSFAAGTHPCYKASSLAFGEFLGMATYSPLFPQL